MIVDRLETRSFEIALFGRVSSGKSSLLNRIIQAEVLPVGVNPITAVPTRLLYGPAPRLTVSYADKDSEQLVPSRLPEFVTEQQNPANYKHVTRIAVELPSPRLRDGIVLVDTPGLGSLATSGAAETLAYLPRCDLGSNTAFTLAFTPSPASSLELYRNGLFMLQGTDYQISANTITFFLASVPVTGDLLVASYRFANPNDPSSTLASPQVVCSSTGSGTTGTALVELGSCTISAGLVGAGDRIEIHFQYGHTGTATGFTGAVQLGGTTVVSRTGAASESLLAGHTSVGTYGGGQAWDTQTWGIALSLAANAGTTSEDTSQGLRVSLKGQMASTTSDSVFLRNFTVIRYPAQANP